MEIGYAYDNSNTKRPFIKDLKKGDKLVCIKSKYGTGDIGMSGQTFRYEAFISGKTYTVNYIHQWDWHQIGYVCDEDGCSTWATPELFTFEKDVLRDEKLNEILSNDI